MSVKSLGNPFDPATEIGPLIHPRHVEKVMSYVTIGQEDGATLACGGEQLSGNGMSNGNYVSATLFTNASNQMRIAQEEVFGPFLTAIPFETDAEALEIANSVNYGLAGYLWTKDVSRAHTFSHALGGGMVWVNSQNVRHLPMGSFRQRSRNSLQFQNHA